MRRLSVALLLPLWLVACGSGEEPASNEKNSGPSGKGGSGSAAGGSSAGTSNTAGTSSTAGSSSAGASGEGGGQGGIGGVAQAGSAGVAGSAGGEAGPSCDKEPGQPGTKALLFDGVDDQVTMGNAKALGLKVFTVEAWVRRDGDGKEMSTGVGGLRVVPIAGKGRGEDDGSNVDCNYAFGFVGEKLGVDFEDQESGENHPLVGNRGVPRGEWHHVAATFDGAALRLYIDGQLDSMLATSAVPRADSIQHFGIGAAFNSKGEAAGAFHGAIDEVRVWNKARTDAQIAETAFSGVTGADGLLARWSFEGGNADGEPSGAPNGAIVGATLLSPGAPLDVGHPPALDTVAPSGGEAVASPATLSVSFEDAESQVFEGEFYLRKITDADDFSLVVLPDTQYYTEEQNDWRKHFFAQTKWIVDNRSEYNIVGVIHNGDITDNGQGIESQWQVADEAMAALEDKATTGLEDGIPYAVTIGNHDIKEPGGAVVTGNSGFFNKYFGIKRFSGRAYYGGHYGSKLNDENYVNFSAGGLDFLVVNYQYIEDDTPYRKAVMKWGRSLFDNHPDAFGIVNSHYIIGATAKFGNQGQALYDSVATAKNVHLMTCGHVSAESRRNDTTDGHTITSMLADYQALGKDTPSPDVPKYEGGSGYLRIWEFSPRNDEVTVRTYSPSLKKWQTDEDSEFTLKVPLRGSGGAFEKIAGVKIQSKTAFAETPALEPGATYEWYAKISDCDHVTTTPIHRFKAK